MSKTPVYCDYNAGAPVRPEAADAVAQALALGGNPSSVHGTGRRAHAALEIAREDVARAVCARAADVVFTSGATEALHLALSAARAAGAGPDLILSAIEHDALAEGAAPIWPGADILPVTSDGIVDLGALKALLADAGGKPLVAVMLANNETGAIQPVREVVEIVHAAGGLVLCDAAQALGRIGLDVAALGADYVVISSHKIGGPPGAGALVLNCGAPFVAPRRGGGQEQGRRPGTQNAPAAAGFGVAAQLAKADDGVRLAALRDRFEAGLKDVTIFAKDAPRLPNTSLFAVPGLKAETAVIAFDLEGVALSSGAACSSGKVRPSRVLAAMGVPTELSSCALRVSFGWASTEDDVDRLLAATNRIVARARPELVGAA